MFFYTLLYIGYFNTLSHYSPFSLYPKVQEHRQDNDGTSRGARCNRAQVIYAHHGSQTLESLGMSLQPVHHVTAIRPSHRSHPGRINIFQGCQFIGNLHYILGWLACRAIGIIYHTLIVEIKLRDGLTRQYRRDGLSGYIELVERLSALYLTEEEDTLAVGSPFVIIYPVVKLLCQDGRLLCSPVVDSKTEAIRSERLTEDTPFTLYKSSMVNALF